MRGKVSCSFKLIFHCFCKRRSKPNLNFKRFDAATNRCANNSVVLFLWRAGSKQANNSRFIPILTLLRDNHKTMGDYDRTDASSALRHMFAAASERNQAWPGTSRMDKHDNFQVISGFCFKRCQKRAALLHHRGALLKKNCLQTSTTF